VARIFVTTEALPFAPATRTPKKIDENLWLVPISKEDFKELKVKRKKTETVSETLIRLFPKREA